MRSTIAFAAAVAAPLVSASLVTSPNGEAMVINQCSYSIPLTNVPAIAADVENGQSESKTLDPAGDNTYTQNWVQLLSGGGWSIKVNPLNDQSALMQFEYTYKPDGNVWYDLSFVGDDSSKLSQLPTWKFIAPDSPTPPTHGAYMAWNDDANGMQVPVPSSATVTLILCTEGSGSGSGSPQTSTVAAPAPATTTAAAAPTTLQTSKSSVVSIKAANVQNSAPAAVTTTPAPAPATTPTTTTPAPVAAAAAAPAADDGDAAVVTEFETKVVTAVVTETAHARRRRHEHKHIHHGHPQ